MDQSFEQVIGVRSLDAGYLATASVSGQGTKRCIAAMPLREM
jgi:hypothetical protein